MIQWLTNRILHGIGGDRHPRDLWQRSFCLLRVDVLNYQPLFWLFQSDKFEVKFRIFPPSTDDAGGRPKFGTRERCEGRYDYWFHCKLCAGPQTPTLSHECKTLAILSDEEKK